MNKKLTMVKVVEQLLIVSSLQMLLTIYVKSAVVPSFFLVWLLVLVWDGNIEIGLVMAFLTGLIYDLVSRGTPGSTSIRFLVLVYAGSFLRVERLSYMFALGFIFSALFFVSFLFEPAKGFSWEVWPMVKYSVIFALINGMMVYLIELVIRRQRWKWKKDYLGMS